MYISFENVFLEKLHTGINLFTGAGFSVLPSTDGNKLPTAGELAKDICIQFDLSGSNTNDLELISMKMRKKNSKGFDQYLREKFRVKGDTLNPLYYNLNLVNIKSYITTNIDNIFQTVVDATSDRYVNSIVNGTAKRNGYAIDYIPLHGDITDLESPLYFGKLEIARAFSDKPKFFTVMEGALYRNPTLFWGYGFHDSDVMTSLGGILNEMKESIWLQFRSKDKALAQEYENDLDFNIIIADTYDLLSYIGERLTSATAHATAPSIIDGKSPWDNYKIPSQNSLDIHVEAAAYYKTGAMEWNVIYSGYPYSTKTVREVHNKFLATKNLIVIGTPQSGKTTLLRQVAISIDMPCYYVSEISKAQAIKLSKAVTQQIVVLFDNCALDIEAFIEFAKNPKIHLLGIADEYSYESSKHLLKVAYEHMFIPDLEREEANAAYEHIPESLRKKEFTYSRRDNEKYSFLEFCIDNIRDVLSEKKVRAFLDGITDEMVKEILFLTAYLTQYNSYLSTDVLWFYLSLKDYRSYNKARHVLDKANQALREIGEEISPDLNDQDYFALRSNLFSYYVNKIATQRISSNNRYVVDYGNVVRKVITKVPRGVITNYHIFKRRAYDADLFYVLFRNEAKDLYDIIYSFDGSAYTLQQKALYLAKNKEFSEAFKLIDEANLKLPNNLSIKNTKAIITFEANKSSASTNSQARAQIDNAMIILENCYQNDTRKIYHAQKFAEFATFLRDECGDARYIETAKSWLNDITKDGDASRNTRYWKRKVFGWSE